MENYTKAPFTHQQHLELLKTRGLIIDNPAEAIAFLKKVNYYRFTAYCIPFQYPHDVFLKGISFETIAQLYHADEELRNAVFGMLAPIEIFLRTQLAYQLSHTWGTFAQYEPAMFQNAGEHQMWLSDLEADIACAHEVFIDHYKTKYNGFPRLPLWMACEVMNMGSLSWFYSYLILAAREKISNQIGVDHNVFKTWVHTLCYVRNICAHHGRLWNRNFTIRPLLPDKESIWLALNLNNKKLFASIAICEWIYKKAGLPIYNVETVYTNMEQIAGIDSRFSTFMGVPVGKAIGMCWGATP